MSKLSRVFSNKRKKKDHTSKSALMERMATRRVIKKSEENMLLGDLFITTEEGEIKDISGNYDVQVCRATVSSEIKNIGTTNSIALNGKNSNINVKDCDKITLGIEDFTLDWWEYKLELPQPNYEEIPEVQYSMYKNTIDKKQPIKVKNTSHKSIYLSSDGDHWDIADDKYMGEIINNEWVHWAIVRCNNNFYTFKNGTLKNIWISDKAINNSDEFFTFGSGPKGNYFYGFMNNIRFTKCQALWTEEFNPNEELFY